MKDTIREGTYIVDIDNNRISNVPHTSVTVKRSGTSRNLVSEDLPELPPSLRKKLETSIESTCRKAMKKKDSISDHDLNEVRVAFFRFNLQLLRGLDSFVRKPGNMFCLDFDNIFDIKGYQQFIAKQCTFDSEFRFYELFTSMSLFTRLVERCVYRQTRSDMQMKEDLWNALQNASRNQFPKAKKQLEECLPLNCPSFHDITIAARQGEPEKILTDTESQYNTLRYKYSLIPLQLD